MVRFHRLRRIHRYGILLALATCVMLLGRLIYNLNLPHVTYLSPDSPALTNSVFSYIHMPAPYPDPRTVYYGNEEISHISDIVNFILKEQPSWKNKRTYIVKVILFFGRFSISQEVMDKTNELLYFVRDSEVPWKFGEIQHSMSILTQRQFPSKPREMSCNNCFPYNFKNIIRPNGVCQEANSVDIVMIVTTIPKNLGERMAVRRTWGSPDLQDLHKFRVIFLFGYGWPEDQIESLKRENTKYNDILMDNFTDNYYNLTQKVMMGFKWVLKECPQVKFVIRSADDTWVDIPALFSMIYKYRQDEAFQKHQVGHCFPAFIPHRGPDYKGYLNTLEYNLHRFPPYALGTVFITSKRLTQELVDISPNVPFIAIEDAYFGLALARLGRGCHHVRGMLGRYTTHTEKDSM